MPRPTAYRKTKKTFLLSDATADAIKDLAAIAGKDQGEIVELALSRRREEIRNALCFVGAAGEHPVASLLDTYQACPGRMSPARTEACCRLARDELDLRRDEFYEGQEYEGKDDLNGYIASRILRPVQEIEGSSFRALRELAEMGLFLSPDKGASYRNARRFANEVEAFCADPASYGCADYLVRVLVVVLRDGMKPVADIADRRRLYRVAKDRGFELV